ncbi:hypothetical protein AKJ16_DCAP07518 [Drosera capensis]
MESEWICPHVNDSLAFFILVHVRLTWRYGECVDMAGDC